MLADWDCSWVGTGKNCANCDQSLKLRMVLDKVMTFKKIDGYKLSKTCTHHLKAKIQDGRHVLIMIKSYHIRLTLVYKHQI